MIPPVTEKAVTAIPENKSSELSRRAVVSGDTFSAHLRAPKPNRTESVKEPARPTTQESNRGKKSPRPDTTDRSDCETHCADAPDEKPVVCREKDLLEPEEEPARDENGGEAAISPALVHIMPVQTAPELETSEQIALIENLPVSLEAESTPTLSAASLSSTTPSDGVESSSAQEAIAASAVSIVAEAAGDASAASVQNDVTVAVERSFDVSANANASTSLQEQTGIVTITDGRVIVPMTKETSSSLLNSTPTVAAAQVASVESKEQPFEAVVKSGELLTPSEEASAPALLSAASETRQAKAPGKVSFARYLFGEANSPSTVDEPVGSTPSMTDLALSGDLVDPSAAKEEAATPRTEPPARSDANPIMSPADAAQAAASTLPPTLRRHMEARGGGSVTTPPSAPISDSQHARLLQRVQRAFRAAEEKGSEIQIRLSPPELGSMKLELSLTSGVLTAKLEVETQRAQTILLDSLPQLRERLAEQGIRIEKFDVNLQQRDSGGQQPQQQPFQPERSPRSSSAGSRAAAETNTNESRIPQRASFDPTRLNVIV